MACELNFRRMACFSGFVRGFEDLEFVCPNNNNKKKIGRDGGERRGLWKCKIRKIFRLGKHRGCRKQNTR